METTSSDATPRQRLLGRGFWLTFLALLVIAEIVLRLAAESFDMRGQGDLIVRALPDRAAEAGMAERDA